MSNILSWEYKYVFRARKGEQSKPAIETMLEVHDLLSAPTSFVEAAVKHFVEAYVGSVIRDSGELPQDGDLLSAAYDWSIATSERKRTVTKETLAQFADTYFMSAQDLLDIPPVAAKAAADLIRDKLARIGGNVELASKLEQRLQQFVELADEELLAPHTGVIEWLLKQLAEIRTASVSVDML